MDDTACAGLRLLKISLCGVYVLATAQLSFSPWAGDRKWKDSGRWIKWAISPVELAKSEEQESQQMSPVFQATFWGFVSGGALVVGAAIGYFIKVPTRVVAAVMAFGSGVLISALSFELMEEAFEEAGLPAAATGFLLGAGIYAAANRLLAIWGAKHRKRSSDQQPGEEEESGSGLAIAVGALLDGIPESIAIGLSILHGGAVSVAMVAAIFLSNLPEGLSSSAGMRRAGRSATYVFGVWMAIAVVCGMSALVGYVGFGGLSPFLIAATTAVAAGAMLTMIVDTMIPEAFAETHDWSGLIAVLGFLVSFSLTKLAG